MERILWSSVDLLLFAAANPFEDVVPNHDVLTIARKAINEQIVVLIYVVVFISLS